MSDFKNQSPWGTPPPGGNGNGDGGFRGGPRHHDVEELISFGLIALIIDDDKYSSNVGKRSS